MFYAACVFYGTAFMYNHDILCIFSLILEVEINIVIIIIIPYSNLITAQIGIYPTLRNVSVIQCGDLGPVLGQQLIKCTHGKKIVYTKTDFEGAGVFVGSRQASQIL